MAPSMWQILIILVVLLLLFARPGKISGIMGDFGKGLKSFKEGIKPEEAGEEEAAADVVKAAPAPKKVAKKTAKKAAKKVAAKKKPAKAPAKTEVT